MDFKKLTELRNSGICKGGKMKRQMILDFLMFMLFLE